MVGPFWRRSYRDPYRHRRLTYVDPVISFERPPTWLGGGGANPTSGAVSDVPSSSSASIFITESSGRNTSSFRVCVRLACRWIAAFRRRRARTVDFVIDRTFKWLTVIREIYVAALNYFLCVLSRSMKKETWTRLVSVCRSRVNRLPIAVGLPVHPRGLFEFKLKFELAEGNRKGGINQRRFDSNTVPRRPPIRSKLRWLGGIFSFPCAFSSLSSSTNTYSFYPFLSLWKMFKKLTRQMVSRERIASEKRFLKKDEFHFFISKSFH